MVEELRFLYLALLTAVAYGMYWYGKYQGEHPEERVLCKECGGIGSKYVKKNK